MQVAYAILADAAEVGPNGKVSMLGGDFETIYLPGFPGVQAQFALVVKLLVDPSECEILHQFRFVLMDPDQVERIQGTGEFTPHKVPDKEDRKVRYLIVMPIPPILWVMPGQYIFHLYVNDAKIGEVALFAEQASNLSAPSPSKGAE